MSLAAQSTQSSITEMNFGSEQDSAIGSRLALHHRSQKSDTELVTTLNNTLTQADLQSQMKEQEQLIEQLCRSAAALIIQSAWRGWSTRRRFFSVTKPDATVLSYCGTDYSERDLSSLPKVDPESLRPQNMLIWKYHKYCNYVEKMRLKQNKTTLPVPEFSQFAAALIQGKWRSWTLRRKYLKILVCFTTAGRDLRL